MRPAPRDCFAVVPKSCPSCTGNLVPLVYMQYKPQQIRPFYTGKTTYGFFKCPSCGYEGDIARTPAKKRSPSIPAPSPPNLTPESLWEALMAHIGKLKATANEKLVEVQLERDALQKQVYDMQEQLNEYKKRGSESYSLN